MADSEKAPAEPAQAQSALGRRPGFFERRRRRADLSRRIAVREELLLELGAIVYELHRQGQRAPELLQARAAQLDEVDSEIRAMQASLDGAGVSAGAWPAAEAEPAGWDAAQTGEWDERGDWDETRDWRPEDEWADDEEEWDDDPDADLEETQEWSADEVDDALGSSNGNEPGEVPDDAREERP